MAITISGIDEDIERVLVGPARTKNELGVNLDQKDGPV